MRLDELAETVHAQLRAEHADCARTCPVRSLWVEDVREVAAAVLAALAESGALWTPTELHRLADEPPGGEP